jgi:hypothetical protein
VESGTARERQVIRARATDSDTPAPAEVTKSRSLVDYLRNLTPARIVLWCYAIWYLLVLVRYFDAHPRVWLTAVGLSGVVGLALLMSTRASLAAGTRVDGWGIFRLFLMPFCVSSFAALVKGRGFILIFPPSWEENAAGIAACGAFVAVIVFLQRRAGGSKQCEVSNE